MLKNPVINPDFLISIFLRVGFSTLTLITFSQRIRISILRISHRTIASKLSKTTIKLFELIMEPQAGMNNLIVKFRNFLRKLKEMKTENSYSRMCHFYTVYNQ